MVYLDFAKAFDKVDHGVLLHTIKMLGITGKLGVWLYNFLTGRTHFVRLQGGVSFDSPLISGVPQGTVLGPLHFIILMCDINSVITSRPLIYGGQIFIKKRFILFTLGIINCFVLSNLDIYLYANSAHTGTIRLLIYINISS